MNLYKDIAERFASETTKHELTILRDDGLYRHLRFRAPGDSAYWFDLITVPGALIFQGDGESFVFRRIADMFEFFRSNPDREITRINPHYWSEKLTNGRRSVQVYSRETFEQIVAEHLADAEERWPGIADGWKLHADDPFDYDLDDEESARRAAADFSYIAAGHDDAFAFSDTWEWDLKDYDWWFLWACFGIVWGIARYDEARKAVPPLDRALAATLAPHTVVLSHAGLHWQVTHPAQCDRLPYGVSCLFDEAREVGGAHPDEPYGSFVGTPYVQHEHGGGECVRRGCPVLISWQPVTADEPAAVAQ